MWPAQIQLYWQGKEFLKGHMPSMALKELLNCFPDGWIGILGMCEVKGIYDSPSSTFSQSFHCGLGVLDTWDIKHVGQTLQLTSDLKDIRRLLKYAALLS